MARPTPQEVKDQKDQAALEAAYNAALTTTEAAPALPPARPASAPVVKKAKGGMIGSASKRADGCATKGKTRGTFV